MGALLYFAIYAGYKSEKPNSAFWYVFQLFSGGETSAGSIPGALLYMKKTPAAIAAMTTRNPKTHNTTLPFISKMTYLPANKRI
jgi:hypothetical protein